MPTPLRLLGAGILTMTWHKVTFTPTGDWVSRMKQQRACVKWCNDNISSTDVLWKYVSDDSTGSTGFFYFAHADQAVLFRLSMGI